MPSSRRIVPWMKPRMNHPNRYRMIDDVETLIDVSVSAMFTQSLVTAGAPRSGPNSAEG